jgi:flagellar M-ring protein FliF
MDFINKLAVQALAFVRAMTPRARATTAVLAAVVLASLVYLVRYELAGQSTYLLGNQSFSTAEITAMQGALGKAQLNDFTVEENRIRIPRNKQAAYLAALADGNALPQSLTDVFSEATEKSSWFTSRQTQAEQARTAKKKGLSLILRSIESVESAEVDFDKEEPRGLKQERSATALVAVKLRAGHTLSEGLATYFQRIAGAALNMPPHDVTVVDKINHVSYGGRGADKAGSAGDDYHTLKRKYQAYYEETVSKALAYVPGVTVSADVELGAESGHDEDPVELDANRAATVEGDTGRAIASETTGNSPQQGAAQPTVFDSLLPLGQAASATPAARRNHGAGAQDPPPRARAGLIPRRVAISVGVPTSYFQAAWRQRRAGLSDAEPSAPSTAEFAQVQAEEMALIRQHVTPLIPGAEASPDDQRVMVTPFSNAAVGDEPARSLDTVLVDWLTSPGNVLALLAVALVGLVSLWIIIRIVIGSTRKPALTVGLSDKAHNDQATPSAPHRRPAARPQAGRSLRDELADMVRENPAAAADVLRSWIGNVN